MRSELELSSKSDPSGFRPLSAFLSPGLDQLPLEFREPTKHSQHQPAVRGCRLGPGIRERPEASASLADCIEDIQQVPS